MSNIINLEKRLHALRVGEDIQIVSENGEIIVMDKGVIMYVGSDWADAIDYIEQAYLE